MTTQEVNIAFRKQLPVTIIESKSNPDLKGGVFKITKFGCFYRKRLKTFDYFVTLENTEEPREVYEILMDEIKPMPGFDLVIQKFINEKKALSEEMGVNNAKNQDRVNQ